jgi:hypothetical protein
MNAKSLPNQVSDFYHFFELENRESQRHTARFRIELSEPEPKHRERLVGCELVESIARKWPAAKVPTNSP